MEEWGGTRTVEMLVISTQGDAGPAGPPGVPGSVVSGAAPALGTRDSQTVNSWGDKRVPASKNKAETSDKRSRIRGFQQ